MNEKPKAKGKLLRFLEEKGFYIILFLCAVAIGIAGYVLFEAPHEESSSFEDADSAAIPDMSAILGSEDGGEPSVPDIDAGKPGIGDGGGIIITAPEPDEAGDAAVLPADADTPDAEPDADTAEAPPPEDAGAAEAMAPVNDEPVAKKEPPAPSQPDFFVKPVPGEVLKAFCITELVYDRTTGDWRTHNGVDIAASNGQLVSAIADGTVTGIYADEYYGACVKIDHGGGLVSVYYGLAENPTVATGDSVKAGDTIGALTTGILFESLDPVHLHLEVTRDGEYVDPLTLFS